MLLKYNCSANGAKFDNSLYDAMQIGEVCQIDETYNDLRTCSNDSVLMSLHLAFVSQLLRVCKICSIVLRMMYY